MLCTFAPLPFRRSPLPGSDEFALGRDASDFNADEDFADRGRLELAFTES